MDFRLTPQQAVFQQEVRTFINDNVPADWASARGSEDGATVARDIRHR